MPLSLADIGEENTVKKIGGSPEVKKHLENLGFVVGGNVTVVTSLGGNVIVNVKGVKSRHKRRNGEKNNDIKEENE